MPGPIDPAPASAAVPPPPSRPPARPWWKHPGCLLALLGFMAFIAFLLSSIREAMELSYGRAILEPALIRFMRDHGGRFPNDWEELHPYCRDMITSRRGAHYARRHWGIAWGLDPRALLRERGENAIPRGIPHLDDPHDDETAVIYRLARETPPPGQTRWLLTPWLCHHLTGEAWQPRPGAESRPGEKP